MYRNFFTIAIRQLRKNKMYSVIKIGGFALSIAACILIALFIRYELSYDKNYPDGDRIYRVYGVFNDNGTLHKGESFQPPMAKTIKKDFPEVEMAGRIMPSPLFDRVGNNYVRREDQKENNYESGFIYADQEFLDILQIPMVYGNRAQALAEPNSLVISKKIADKYFPGQNPLGKLFVLNDDTKRALKIGGVMQNFPSNSHLQYDFLMTLTNVELWPGEQPGWRSSNYPIYLKLRPGTNPVAFEKKLTRDILHNYIVASMKEAGDKRADEIKKNASLHLQPISDIYLGSYDFDGNIIKNTGDIRIIKLFGFVAI